MPRQYRGKAPRKNDIRYQKRLAVCPICSRTLSKSSISVGDCESVCPECLDEYKRRNTPSEVRICIVCRESTTTPYANLPGGEIVCSEECFDEHEQNNDFSYGEEDDLRLPSRY